MFEIVDEKRDGAVIKVIGVGGCGGNAVKHMMEKGVEGVEFIVANTDAQALDKSPAPKRISLGAQLTKVFSFRNFLVRFYFYKSDGE